ncbi:hypothetical protein HNV11_18715 [Spirosoma taeanense]|uniref:Uncharacterized protein n=1 Tax=Spirosoma taeanense TaxID=2735870 RepID=A0A6M5YE60_9BACT|nr:hypothetical protein [Spirosoma taeanense]QJW91262.1 hypothetical protein HNV11_18715 [Spirosoma taeanense]
MKKVFFTAASLLFCLAGCTIKREVIQPNGNDFSSAILKAVPAETIAKIRDLGVPVYDGRTPPPVEGAYLISRLYMTKSTVPNEPVKPDGFADLKLKIYNQNRTALTASLDTKAVDGSRVIATSTGQGTLLSGSGNFFSLFIVLETVRPSNGSRSRTLDVYSGEITPTGIRNLQSTLFMLNDYGDPNNDLIPVNTGRAFKDNDGFSESISNFRIAAPDDESGSQLLRRTLLSADSQ